MLKQAIFTNVFRELDSCIACNKCLDTCPVYSKKFSVEELNNATKKQTSISSEIVEFTFSCMQCRQCVPVCPNNLHRDEMMLALKHKLRHQKPRSYRRYLLIRGPKLSIIRSIFQQLFVFYRKLCNRDIAPYFETNENPPNSLLFYPGCYVYSPKTMRQTLHLLKHVGTSFGVLAGLSHCCGMPYYLQGEFQQAELCLAHLKNQLKEINPTVIISGCNECLEAIQLINKYYHTSYQTRSIVEYLMDNIDKFPGIKLYESVTLHDACRYNRQKRKGTAARLAIKRFSTLKEMPHTRSDAMCCAKWNYEADSNNSSLREKRLMEGKNTASIIACECLTCYEQYSKIDTNVRVVDVLELFVQSLEANTKK